MTNDEISIAELWAALKRCWYWIVGGAVAFAAIGIGYSFLATPLYTAKTTVVIVDNGGANSLLSSLPTGIASLAGSLGLVGGGGGDSKTYMAVLSSRELANQFILQQQMLPYLFPDRWDKQKHAWREEKEAPLHRLLHAVGLSGHKTKQNAVPSPWRAYKKFREIRTIQDNSATDGTVTIEFETRDPESAAKWANSYVTLANKEIRGRVIKEASQALSYLKKRAQDTSLVGLRDTIYQLVETHLEKITLANVRPEYAFRVIDRAVQPDVKSWPKTSLIVVVAFLVGGLLGGFVGLIKDGVLVAN